MKRDRFGFSMAPEIKKELDAYAKKNGLSTSELVRSFIVKGLEEIRGR